MIASRRRERPCRQPAKPARERAESFLRDAVQFRLGALVTEASHPRSTELSQVARQDAAAGLAVLFDVDRDVVETYDRWSRSAQPAQLCDDLVATLEGGGRVFFTGCGATGRLSIQLNAVWRAFWQDRRERGLATPPPDAWEGRARSVMAGGDYALIKSVEGFEDFAPFGRRQIADLGVAKGDMVFAITEGGETSFVIGTAWQGLEAGARVAFVYNNPDEVLRAHVTRSREVIDEPRIRKVNLTTGPMAITGSTRMQATSIELLAMLTVLEMALREVLARSGATAPGLGPSGDVPGAMREGLRALHDELAGERLRDELARLVVAEEQAYRRGARTSYFADSLAVDVLTDTTERSPTFCTPSFRKWDDGGGLGVVGVPLHPGRHDRGGLDAAPPAGPADDRVDGGGPPGAPRRGGRGEAGRDPARDRPARADAVPHRPRRPRLSAGARGRRRHDRGGGEGPPPAGGRGRLRRRAGAGTGGGGLRSRDRRGPAGGARAPHRGARGERERRA